MAKISKTQLTNVYAAASKASKKAKENNDCAVVSLSVASGKTYDEAHSALAAAGRENGKATFLAQMETAAEKLGLKLERLPQSFIDGIIAQYPGIHKTLKHITTHHPVRFPKVWAEVVEPLIFHVDKHFAGYREGAIHDWSVNSAKRVIDLYRLVPNPVGASSEEMERWADDGGFCQTED